MKQKQFFSPILKESWGVTWRNKGWWFVGLLAVFLMGSLSYQLVLQGIRSLANPDSLVLRWQAWSVLAQPLDLITGQLEVFKSAPVDWLILAGVWVVIAAAVVLLFSISVYALTLIISAAKNYASDGRINLVDALSEASLHFKSVFGAILLLMVATNVLMILFSLPIVALGFGTGAASAGLLGLVFALFLVVSFFVSVVGLYTIMAIILDNNTLSPSIIDAYKMLRNHLVVSIEMFIIQILIAVVAALILVLLAGLLVVPVAIVGTLLVAAQQFDITTILPAAILFLLAIGFLIVGAIYTVFQLFSWTMMYMRLEAEKPYSRLAAYAEVTFRISR